MGIKTLFKKIPIDFSIRYANIDFSISKDAERGLLSKVWIRYRQAIEG